MNINDDNNETRSTEKEISIKLRLDESLDRLETYFKKREEIKDDPNLTSLEKLERYLNLRRKYNDSLKIENIVY